MSVKVAVRVRPFSQREVFLSCQCCVQMMEGKTQLFNGSVNDDTSKKQFTFDYSFWSHDCYKTLENGLMVPVTDKYWSQQRVFNEIGLEVINNAWEGYNCCLFAYGQTGAGKSYSMIGYGVNRGIVPLVCEQIFNRIDRNQQKNKLYEVTVNMIQIYNQKVQDLLVPDSKNRPPGGLEIRQSKKLGVYVDGVTKHTVRSFKEIEKWMEQGSKNRSLASTLMNQYSSRAHTIISIEFVQREELSKKQVIQKTSAIHLVDLAGSQRVAKTGLANADRLKEAGNINKSLHHLGLVIEILAEKSMGRRKNEVVPYRSSCLTRILQNSLGGNSKTIMICAISPASDNYDESLSTLRYADQVKKIKNNATINQSSTDKLIRQLRAQNQRLKVMIQQLHDKSTITPNQVNLLEDALEQQKQVQKNISKNRQAMKSFAVATQQTGDSEDSLLSAISDFDLDKLDQSDHQISAIVYMDMFNNTEPYLTNLNQDQLLSGKLKYNIEQQLVVGRKNGEPTPQVILGAMGIEPNHAKIYRRLDRIFISTYTQTAGDFTYVNGQNVYESTEVFHNDRIVFGTSCVFVLKTPQGVARKPISDVDLTYQFAIAQLQKIDKNKSMVEDEQLLTKLKQIQIEIAQEKAKMQTKIIEQQNRFREEMARVKAQQQMQSLKLQEELKRKQEEAQSLKKQRQELQLIKQASKKLQEQLEKQREEKLLLQKNLEQSIEMEQSLRERKEKQLLQLQQREAKRLQILRLQQQAQQAEQRLKKHELQRLEQLRLQEQRQKQKVEQAKRKEEQAKKQEQTMKRVRISCQNQNILEERLLELKKKKKEVEQLRNLLIKKERVELQKKLVDLLPLLVECNLIAKQMQRQIELSVKIDYEYFGYYELTECLKHSSYKSRIKLKVMVENSEEGRVYYWPIQTFKNRLHLSRDMMERYIQNPSDPVLQDKDNDPFWDPKEYELIGQGFLTLQHLLFNLDYTNPQLAIIGDKSKKGTMAVRIYPTTADGSQNLSKQQQKKIQIHNPRAIFQKDLHFIVAIDEVKLNVPDVIEYYIEYDILENNYKFVKYQTNKLVKPQVNYFRKHLFKQITQPTLLYVNGSQICFSVYGLRKSHPLERRSVRIECLPTEAQIQKMNDMVSRAKSAVTPPRQTKSQIYQNPDVMDQIEKQYNASHTKASSSVREKSPDDTKSVRSGKTDKSYKSTSSSGEKDKQKCMIF